MDKIHKEAQDIKTKYFWITVFSEFLGTTFFIFLVTAVVVNVQTTLPSAASVCTASFGIGLSVSILVQVFGPVSGAHMNPAVTIAALMIGDIGVIKTIFYTLAQLVGGITGSAITYGLTPAGRRGNLANLMLPTDLSVAQGFFMEVILTMIFILTVLASVLKDHGRKNFGFANAHAIGLAIVAAHLIGIPYSGSGVNPARAFGPAVVMGSFPSHHWVYWLGPYLGAILAALLYKYIFSLEAPSVSVKHNDTQLGSLNKETTD